MLSLSPIQPLYQEVEGVRKDTYIYEGITFLYSGHGWFYASYWRHNCTTPVWVRIKGAPAHKLGCRVWLPEYAKMIKPIRPVGPENGPGSAETDGFLVSRNPRLLEFLTMTRWPHDGSRRETGSLMVFVENGRWKGTLKDRDGGHVVFLTGDTFLGLLEAFETGLEAEDLGWRVDQFHRPHGPKGKQKK